MCSRRTGPSAGSLGARLRRADRARGTVAFLTRCGRVAFCQPIATDPLRPPDRRRTALAATTLRNTTLVQSLFRRRNVLPHVRVVTHSKTKSTSPRLCAAAAPPRGPRDIRSTRYRRSSGTDRGPCGNLVAALYDRSRTDSAVYVHRIYNLLYINNTRPRGDPAAAAATAAAEA